MDANQGRIFKVRALAMRLQLAIKQVGSSEMSVSNVVKVVYSTSAHVRIRAVFGSEYGVEAPLLTFHITW